MDESKRLSPEDARPHTPTLGPEGDGSVWKNGLVPGYGNLGYELRYTTSAIPFDEEIDRYGRLGIAVRKTGSVPDGERPVAAAGDVQLTLCPLPEGDGEAPPGVAPLVPRHRGTAAHPMGVDTELWTRHPLTPAERKRLALEGKRSDSALDPALREAGKARPPGPRSRPLAEILRHIGVDVARVHVPSGGRPVVVAVIDEGFAGDRESSEIAPVEDTPVLPGGPPHVFNAATEERHGTRMVLTVAGVLEGKPFLIRRIRLPPASSTLLPTHLALAVAHAVAPPQPLPPADVVLLAVSTGTWGTPPHLDAVLTAAARAGRGGKGAVIVCSTGTFKDNKYSVLSRIPSVAHGADELGSHPDVLLVAPCDLTGRWFRASPSIIEGQTPGVHDFILRGRMGPSVAIAAPGVMAILDRDNTFADNSSLSAAITAGVAALTLLANPGLTALETRLLFRRTSLVPEAADAPHGPEVGRLASFDRTGHNFKVGAGMINALGAVLAALDPVAHGLLRVGGPPRPPAEPVDLARYPDHAIGRWLDYWVDQAASTAPTAEYNEIRGLLTRLLLCSPRLEEELGWILRHLFAIFMNSRYHTWFNHPDFRGDDHGALVRRLRRLARTANEELRALRGRLGLDVDREAAALAERALTWLADIERGLVPSASGVVEHVLGAALLGRHVETGRRPEKSSRWAGEEYPPVPFDLLGLDEITPDPA